MQAKHQLTPSVLPRYLRANKEGEERILDEYCANTGYHRKHAIRKLKQHQFTQGIRWEKVYDMRVQGAMATLWNAYDRICAERIHPSIGEMVHKLSTCSILKLDPGTEAKVTGISLETLKRLLRNIRERGYKKIHGTTKPGTLLKNQIPLRIILRFEAEAVLGKAQEQVFKAVQRIRGRLPFEHLGIDSDNDGSFINNNNTVLRKRSCSLDPVLTRRMIMRILNRSTGHE